jgi:glycerate kinase
MIPPLRVVIAPNAFKGSLSPAAAAQAMADGVRRAVSDAECIVRPVADGGDGSLDAFSAAGFARRPVTTRGPTGDPVDAAYATDGSTAVVELASTCGLLLLPGDIPAPMTSTTEGLGDAIRAALDHGVTSLVVCLGGSASTDGGTGLLVALGARLTDAAGHEVRPGGAGLRHIVSVDLAGLDPRLARTTVAIAADVTSPLVGPAGAAAVFAPQKGATPDEVAELDEGLRMWADVLVRATGRDVSAMPGAGAAGGAAAALLAVCGATMSPGAALIADLLGLDDAIASAHLVLTGEGRLDAQSILGKGAVAVAARAHALRVPTLAICGAIDLDEPAMRDAGFDGWAELRSPSRDPRVAMRDAHMLLAAATEEIVRDWVAS